jgi:lipopolysaccharide export system permease protein
VTPLSERRFADWWDGFTAGDDPEREKAAIWLRSADAIMRVGGIAASGEALNDIQIVYLSQHGLLTRWLEAEQARHTPEGWMLHDVRTTAVENGRIVLKHEGDVRWPSVLDAASIVELGAQPENLSTAQLRRILSGTSAGESSPSHYLTQLHRSYAVPLASPLMVLLAAPAGYAIRRRGHTARGLALGFGLGMAYLVTDGLLSALGGAGALPAALAAWVTPALFAVIGASTLLHCEE